MNGRMLGHLQAILEDVVPLLAAGDPVVIGAAALALGGEAPGVLTQDIDLVVDLGFEEIAAAMQGTGWSREPLIEHRWTRAMSSPDAGRSSPLRGLMDVVPTTREQLRAGRVIWPESKVEMSLAGMAAARRAARKIRLATGATVRVAPPAAIMLLKLIALGEARLERTKDLDHVGVLLECYQRDSERCFAPEVIDLGLPYPLVPAWLLGCDVGHLANSDDCDRVRNAVEWLSTPDSTQLLLAARRGPVGWDRTTEPLTERLAAFVLGMEGAQEPG